MWAVPVIVIVAIYFSPRHLLSAQTALTGLLALGLLVLAAQRPDRSLLALIVLLPFQGLHPGEAVDLAGLPASVVSHLGAWKEALALGVIVAGVRNLIATGGRLDRLDRLALAFVALVVLYALLQPEIMPGAPSTSSLRLLGFRETGASCWCCSGLATRRSARDSPDAPRSALIAVGGGRRGAQACTRRSSLRLEPLRGPHSSSTPSMSRWSSTPSSANPANIRSTGRRRAEDRADRLGVPRRADLAFWLVLPFAVGFERGRQADGVAAGAARHGPDRRQRCC